MIGNQCKICKIYDDVFDAEYLYEIFAILQDKLQYRSDNTANRNTWPYGKTGTHKLFGSKIFFRQSVNKIIYQLVGGLKSSMGYLGSPRVVDLRKKPKFVKITKAGFYESMVHNIDELKK